MSDGHVTIAREDQVTLPTRTLMMVETGDWVRIRKNLERLGDSTIERMSTLGSIVLGAGVGLIGICISVEIGSQGTSALHDVLWAVGASCLFFAACFLILGLGERRRYRVSNLALCADMDDVAERLGHSGLGVVSRVPSPGVKARIKRWWHGDAAMAPNGKPQRVRGPN